MAKNTIALKDFEPKGSHTYLLDTNMWIYLHWPIGSTQLKLQESVGKFIEKCKRVNAEIVTTSFILAEFFHVTLGFSFDQWIVEQNSSKVFKLKKDYRPTEHFKENVTIISSLIDKISKMTSSKQDKFETIDLANILANCMHAEFFDNHTLELSNDNGWIIVSNDNDLLDHPNRKVLIVTP